MSEIEEIEKEIISREKEIDTKKPILDQKEEKNITTYIGGYILIFVSVFSILYICKPKFITKKVKHKKYKINMFTYGVTAGIISIILSLLYRLYLNR